MNAIEKLPTSSTFQSPSPIQEISFIDQKTKEISRPIFESLKFKVMAPIAILFIATVFFVVSNPFGWAAATVVVHSLVILGPLLTLIVAGFAFLRAVDDGYNEKLKLIGLPYGEVKQLSTPLKNFLIEHAKAVFELRRKGVDPFVITKLPMEKLEVIFKNPDAVASLMRIGGVSFKSISDLDLEKLHLIINRDGCVIELMKSGWIFEEITKLKESALNLSIGKPQV